MANEKATHVMVHRNQYLRVNGTIQKIEVGDDMTLTPAQAQRFGDKVKKIGSKKPVELTVGQNEESKSK
tara:strand:+ start:647 stop:853 length:207 start_codon:yes stop_codon:yes gene_type:complete